MSNNHTQGASSQNPQGYRRERDSRWQSSGTFNGTGGQPASNVGRGYAGAFDFEAMIDSLRELFARDRQMASQQDSKRCGICYLYFSSEELRYREEEGFYVCPTCQQALGKQTVRMIRRQQK